MPTVQMMNKVIIPGLAIWINPDNSKSFGVTDNGKWTCNVLPTFNGQQQEAFRPRYDYGGRIRKHAMADDWLLDQDSRLSPNTAIL